MVGIVHVNNLGQSHYLKDYINILRADGVEFELVYWDRRGDESRLPDVTSHVYSKAMTKGMSTPRKMLNYIGYMRFLRAVLEKRGYDKLIVFTAQAAQLIMSILLERYKNRFFFDIRDFTREDKGVFRRREARIVAASWRTAISSEGFRSFLPQSDEYVLAHNIFPDDIELAESFTPAPYRQGQRINIVYNGLKKYMSTDRRIMSKLAGDPRFQLFYNGSSSFEGQYEDFCKTSNIDSVVFFGRFTSEDKPRLLAGAHLLHNYFEGKASANAMSARYYDGVVYGIPSIVNPQTFCGKRTSELGLGISIDIDDPDYADKLYNAFITIDRERFLAARDKEYASILRQRENYHKEIRRFISS